MSGCEVVLLELEGYLRGELTPSAAEQVAAHLATCAACRAEADELEPLLAAVADAYTAPLAGGLDPSAVADAVLARPRRRSAWVPLAAAAALVLLALGWVLAPSRQPTDPIAQHEEPPVDEPQPIASEEPSPRIGEPSLPIVVPPEAPTDGLNDEPVVDDTPIEEGKVPTDEVPSDEGPIDEAPRKAPVKDPSPPLAVPPSPANEDPSVKEPPASGEPTRSKAPSERPAESPVVAFAARVRGEVWVRRADGSQAALAVGDVVRAGEGVTTGKGADAELRSGSAPTPAWSGDRVVLGASTDVGVARADWLLEHGQCFVAGDATVRAGLAKLALRGGELVLSQRRGAITCDLLSGAARLTGDGRQLELAAGQRARVNRSGRPRRRTGNADLPAQLRDAARGGSLLFAEPCASPRYSVLVGEQRAASLASHEMLYAGERRQIVSFGHGDGRGLFAHRPGARLSFRVRAEAPGPLSIQLRDVTQRRDYRAVLQALRPGQWRWVHVQLEELTPAAGGAQRVVAGDRLDLLAVRVGTPGDPVPFEVADLRVVAPPE